MKKLNKKLGLLLTGTIASGAILSGSIALSQIKTINNKNTTHLSQPQQNNETSVLSQPSQTNDTQVINESNSGFMSPQKDFYIRTEMAAIGGTKGMTLPYNFKLIPHVKPIVRANGDIIFTIQKEDLSYGIVCIDQWANLRWDFVDSGRIGDIYDIHYNKANDAIVILARDKRQSQNYGDKVLVLYTINAADGKWYGGSWEKAMKRIEGSSVNSYWSVDNFYWRLIPWVGSSNKYSVIPMGYRESSQELDDILDFSYSFELQKQSASNVYLNLNSFRNNHFTNLNELTKNYKKRLIGANIIWNEEAQFAFIVMIVEDVKGGSIQCFIGNDINQTIQLVNIGYFDTFKDQDYFEYFYNLPLSLKWYNTNNTNQKFVNVNILIPGLEPQKSSFKIQSIDNKNKTFNISNPAIFRMQNVNPNYYDLASENRSSQLPIIRTNMNSFNSAMYDDKIYAKPNKFVQKRADNQWELRHTSIGIFDNNSILNSEAEVANSLLQQINERLPKQNDNKIFYPLEYIKANDTLIYPFAQFKSIPFPLPDNKLGFFWPPGRLLGTPEWKFSNHYNLVVLNTTNEGSRGSTAYRTKGAGPEGTFLEWTENDNQYTVTAPIDPETNQFANTEAFDFTTKKLDDYYTYIINRDANEPSTYRYSDLRRQRSFSQVLITETFTPSIPDELSIDSFRFSVENVKPWNQRQTLKNNLPNKNWSYFYYQGKLPADIIINSGYFLYGIFKTSDLKTLALFSGFRKWYTQLIETSVPADFRLSQYDAETVPDIEIISYIQKKILLGTLFKDLPKEFSTNIQDKDFEIKIVNRDLSSRSVDVDIYLKKYIDEKHIYHEEKTALKGKAYRVTITDFQASKTKWKIDDNISIDVRDPVLGWSELAKLNINQVNKDNIIDWVVAKKDALLINPSPVMSANDVHIKSFEKEVGKNRVKILFTVDRGFVNSHDIGPINIGDRTIYLTNFKTLRTEFAENKTVPVNGQITSLPSDVKVDQIKKFIFDNADKFVINPAGGKLYEPDFEVFIKNYYNPTGILEFELALTKFYDEFGKQHSVTLEQAKRANFTLTGLQQGEQPIKDPTEYYHDKWLTIDAPQTRVDDFSDEQLKDFLFEKRNLLMKNLPPDLAKSNILIFDRKNYIDSGTLSVKIKVNKYLGEGGVHLDGILEPGMNVTVDGFKTISHNNNTTLIESELLFEPQATFKPSEWSLNQSAIKAAIINQEIVHYVAPGKNLQPNDITLTNPKEIDDANGSLKLTVTISDRVAISNGEPITISKEVFFGNLLKNTEPQPTPPPFEYTPTEVNEIIDATEFGMEQLTINEALNMINEQFILQNKSKILTGTISKFNDVQQIKKISLNKASLTSINVSFTLRAGAWYTSHGLGQNDKTFNFTITNLKEIITPQPDLFPDTTIDGTLSFSPKAGFKPSEWAQNEGLIKNEIIEQGIVRNIAPGKTLTVNDITLTNPTNISDERGVLNLTVTISADKAIINGQPQQCSRVVTISNLASSLINPSFQTPTTFKEGPVKVGDYSLSTTEFSKQDAINYIASHLSQFLNNYPQDITAQDFEIINYNNTLGLEAGEITFEIKLFRYYGQDGTLVTSGSYLGPKTFVLTGFASTNINNKFTTTLASNRLEGLGAIKATDAQPNDNRIKQAIINIIKYPARKLTVNDIEINISNADNTNGSIDVIITLLNGTYLSNGIAAPIDQKIQLPKATLDGFKKLEPFKTEFSYDAFNVYFDKLIGDWSKFAIDWNQNDVQIKNTIIEKITNGVHNNINLLVPSNQTINGKTIKLSETKPIDFNVENLVATINITFDNVVLEQWANHTTETISFRLNLRDWKGIVLIPNEEYINIVNKSNDPKAWAVTARALITNQIIEKLNNNENIPLKFRDYAIKQEIINNLVIEFNTETVDKDKSFNVTNIESSAVTNLYPGLTSKDVFKWTSMSIPIHQAAQIVQSNNQWMTWLVVAAIILLIIVFIILIIIYRKQKNSRNRGYGFR